MESCDKSYPLKIAVVKKTIWFSLINLRMLFLRNPKLSIFWRLESSLFPSLIVTWIGKEKTVVVFSSIILKRYCGICFCKFCRTIPVFCTNVVLGVTLNLVLEHDLQTINCIKPLRFRNFQLKEIKHYSPLGLTLAVKITTTKYESNFNFTSILYKLQTACCYC